MVILSEAKDLARNGSTVVFAHRMPLNLQPGARPGRSQGTSLPPVHPSIRVRCMRFLRSVVLPSVLLPTALAAQSIPRAEYAVRRDSLAGRIDSGVVVAYGGRTPVGPERFSQLPAFRYLTGFLEPDAAFVMVVRPGSSRATLFTAERDPRRALYDGFPPDSAEVARRTGIDARSIGALPQYLDSLGDSGLPFYTLIARDNRGGVCAVYCDARCHGAELGSKVCRSVRRALVRYGRAWA
jgi:hypothetical protein